LALKLNKQDLLDIYNILFWVRANELQKAQNIIEGNKSLQQKVYSDALKKK
jgi:hypothetical protein